MQVFSWEGGFSVLGYKADDRHHDDHETDEIDNATHKLAPLLSLHGHNG